MCTIWRSWRRHVLTICQLVSIAGPHTECTIHRAHVIVNQIETHPFLAWDDCVSFCQREKIAIMAYSPLAKAQKMKDPTLCRLARKCARLIRCFAAITVTVSSSCRYSRTPAQIMIKWSLQRGFICIPKTSRKERIVENFDVFDFKMTKEDVQELVSCCCEILTSCLNFLNSACC